MVQAFGHFPAAQAHGHKYFDPDEFFQSKMAMGHGGLLLAEWLLLLPTLPESRLVLLTLHAPTTWCIWNENLPDERKQQWAFAAVFSQGQQLSQDHGSNGR